MRRWLFGSSNSSEQKKTVAVTEEKKRSELLSRLERLEDSEDDLPSSLSNSDIDSPTSPMADAKAPLLSQSQSITAAISDTKDTPATKSLLASLWDQLPAVFTTSNAATNVATEETKTIQDTKIVDEIKLTPAVPKKPISNNAVLGRYKDPDYKDIVQAYVDYDDETLEDPSEPFTMVSLMPKAAFQLLSDGEEVKTEELEPDDLPIEPYEWVEGETVKQQFEAIKQAKEEAAIREFVNIASEAKEDSDEEKQLAAAIDQAEKEALNYPETETEWPVPAALRASWWWSYDKLPTKNYDNPQSYDGDYIEFHGFRYNAKYAYAAGAFAVTVGAITFAGPNIYFAFTAPMTKGTLSLAYLASQNFSALALGTTFGSFSAYVNIRLLRGTIPLAIAGTKDWVHSFPEHPYRATAIGVLAITGAAAQAFLANEAFNWASPAVRTYMTSSNFGGFIFIRGFGLNNAAKRYDTDFAPLSRADKISAVLQWKNLFALPPAIVAAIVFGQKVDGALTKISNDTWTEQATVLRAFVDIGGAFANPVLYFGQIQQIPTTASQTALVTKEQMAEGARFAWINPVANFVANSFAAFSGLSIGEGVVTDKNFFLKSMPDILKDLTKYGMMVSVGLVNGKLLFAAAYKHTPRQTHDFDSLLDAPPPTGLIRAVPVTDDSDSLLAEIKAIGKGHAAGPHFLFAYRRPHHATTPVDLVTQTTEQSLEGRQRTSSHFHFAKRKPLQGTPVAEVTRAPEAGDEISSLTSYTLLPTSR